MDNSIPDSSMQTGATSDLQTTTPFSDGYAELPTEAWSLEQLAEYVRKGFAQGESAATEAKALAEKLKFTYRTSILSYFRAGKALSIARSRLKPGRRLVFVAR